MEKHKFPYKWNLADGYPAKGIKKNGLKVFGTFICGGGSTMGYKLAGFEHLGGVEIDPKVADVYKTNHNPKYLFTEDLRLFNERTDLPKELFNLDILDGSPPCSSFSMAGSREKAWGKEKVFREGQAKQVLDDLVFVYCETIKKLKPKVFILENVKGIIQGNAKTYSKKIVQTMEEAGYQVQVFLLNAASMGVPQKRERVFFIGSLKELQFRKLKIEFKESPVIFQEIEDTKGKRLPIQDKTILKYLKNVTKNGVLQTKKKSLNGKIGAVGFTFMVTKENVPFTVIANNNQICFYNKRDYITNLELKKIGSYPLDYSFRSIEPKYLIGMSVPPVMTAQIANQIYEQWFK